MALFDSNKELVGKVVQDSLIYSIEDLPEYLREHRTDIAVLTIPKDGALDVVETLVEGGIQAIWNFASVDIPLPNSQVVVENVHLSDGLRVLTYRLKELREQKEHLQERGL